MAQDVVIVGAGHGGVETVDALRREGHDGSIVLVDGARRPPHQRPPLSGDSVKPGAEPVPLPLRGDRFYGGQRIEVSR